MFSGAKRNLFLIGSTWLALWVIPWGKIPLIQGNLLLAFLTEMSRLGLALGMFIVPGALLHILLYRDDDFLPDPRGILPIGFALSVFLSSAVGLAGRFAGCSFEVVKISFVVIGGFEFLCLAVLKPDFTVPKGHFLGAIRSALKNPPLVMALGLATLLTFHDSLFFIDDLTYLAYLTNWQGAAHLGFYNIIHPVDNVIEIERFWLAMYPMGQALLSDLSGVPGILLLGNYLELFLVPLAVVALYWFARVMGLSRQAAGFAALIQVSLYCWMIGWNFPVGMWFYQSMAEDKVSAAFLLAPVFFVYVGRFLQRPGVGNFIFVVASGLGLTFTHPVILYFACIIASGLGLFSWVMKRSGGRAIFLLAIAIISLMLPYAVIRLYNYSATVGFALDAKSAKTSYQIERYTNVVNDVFYGLNPAVLQFFELPPEHSAYRVFQWIRPFPFALTLLAGVFALAKTRKGALYWYISSCVLLIVFATLPYTGWILGFFTNARLISRAAWFAPLGLGGVLVLKTVSGWRKAGRQTDRGGGSRRHKLPNAAFIGMVVCFAFVFPRIVFGSFLRVPFYFENLDHNRQLAQIGVYIDKHTFAPVTSIAVDYVDTQLLPGVAAHTSLISFREEKDDNGHNFFLPVGQIHERMYASNTIRSLEPTAPAGEKCRLIQEYKVKYVVASVENAEEYRRLVETCGLETEVVFETRNLILLEFTVD